MKKLNKVAILFATAALATVAGAKVTAADGGTAINNWQNGTSELVWKNGTNELCWRDASWTPATAAAGCDGALAPKVVAAAPVAVAEEVVMVAEEPVAQVGKVTFSADTFFDFDKAVLKPEGKAKLDELATLIQDINLEVVVAVGFTDSIGTVPYNLKLSERRANAVKAYLEAKGIPQDRIYTEGKGKADPIASNKTKEGRAQNRRVEIEVVGTAAK